MRKTVFSVCSKGVAAFVLVASLLLCGLRVQAQTVAASMAKEQDAIAAEWQKLKGEITLYMTNDMGRNGYYDQKPIAELMGEMAGVVDPECACRGRHPPLQWCGFHARPFMDDQL